MPRTTTEKLDDSINVPLPAALKRKIVERARKCGAASYTSYARAVLRKHIEKDRCADKAK